MVIDFLLDIFKEFKTNTAIIWRNEESNYNDLLDKFELWMKVINQYSIRPGDVVALIGDFSPNSVALMLALIEKRCILVPLNISNTINHKKLIDLAQVKFIFSVDSRDKIVTRELKSTSSYQYYTSLKKIEHPGLVLFSSGTSGEPKAAVHDLSSLLTKFKTKRKALRTLNFMLFDHWGGLNTMFHMLSNGGCLITTDDRTPDKICELIEKYKIELLPVTPTFLNLLLLSEAYKRYNLDSLNIISYGTEPMPKYTLEKLNLLFPSVKLLQTYGLIEVGVLRSKSKSNDSLWVSVGGEGYDTRVVDGILHIKAESAMMGYLNAPNPFTKDGWFITGDSVKVDGEYIKILGRKSELINVGGEKVYPGEVENVIQQLENVADVIVYGQKNPIIGNIVCADVKLLNDENKSAFKIKLKAYCIKHLSKYKIPVKVNIVDSWQHGDRFKKIRSGK